ncbi:MAG: hypothetical protein JSR77_01995 [Planctomycetes bacterium]|nr:hypothetical protein [Planctomycetota bacterium]
MHQLRRFASLLIVLVVTLSARALGQMYQDPVNHWSARVPEGWLAATPEQLVQINDYFSRVVKGNMQRYIACFAPRWPFEENDPYILVQAQTFDTSAMTIDEMVKGLSGGATKGVEETIKESSGGLVAGTKFEAPVADRDNNRVIYGMHMTTPAGKGSRAHCVMHLTASGLVQFNCYAPDESFDAAKPGFDAFLASVTIDPGQEFKGRKKSKGSSGGAIGGVLGAMAAVIIASRRRRQKQRAAGACS